MASVEALAPRPNDVVLDCCAAPGSKTTQFVERCEGGCVVAVEYDAKRARALVARSLHVCGGDRAASRRLQGRRHEAAVIATF